MGAIKLLLADVDGTLVTHEKVLTPRAIAAVKKMREKGIAFAVTSGRPPRGMAMLVEPLDLDLPLAGFNGGVYVNPDMSVVEEHNLSPEQARTAAETMLGTGLDLWVYTGQEWLIRKADAPHVAREQKTVQFPPRVVANFDDVLDKAVKLVAISDDDDKIKGCLEAVQKKLGDQVTAALSQPYYLDVTHTKANKGDVVGFLAKRLGLSLDAIATIGDMPNDITMFKKGGLSIAMGNAGDVVKGAADVVTGDCDHDGFADAVARHVLGEG
jgi:Cof subfamily protein (haloacid dehalogenase superfamily)